MVPEWGLGLVIGLLAGAVGGLAGIGGSIVMLPALGLLLGYSGPDSEEHHLYMAAAMIVNGVVSVSASWRHFRRKAIPWRLVGFLAPSMGLAILAGVELSSVEGGANASKLGLVAFLLAYCAWNILTARKKSDEDEKPGQTRLMFAVASGAATGLAAGFLGIGGGIVLVPLLTAVARVPIRWAVAASSAVMTITSPIGAGYKLTTLHEFDVAWMDAVWLAVPMGIGALVGAQIGAALVHRLRTPQLKIAISVVLAIAGLRLAWGVLSDSGVGKKESVDSTRVELGQERAEGIQESAEAVLEPEADIEGEKDW